MSLTGRLSKAEVTAVEPATDAFRLLVELTGDLTMRYGDVVSSGGKLQPTNDASAPGPRAP